MHSNCILDSVGNVQKSTIASHLKGLDQSEMFLSLHMIFSLERAAVVWAILERISGFDPSLEIIAPRYLKFSTSSSLWPFILISLWKPFGLFVITFVLSGPISILYLVVVLSRWSIRTPVFSSSSALATVSKNFKINLEGQNYVHFYVILSRNVKIFGIMASL